MRLSMWTYAWDVIDLGVATSVRHLRERCGVDGVSLAIAYHAGRFLQPRNPKRRVYFPEDGTIYFRPNPERWRRSRLKPKVADVLGDGDILADLAAERDRSCLSVSAWTVCLHNTRLGLLHPDVATRNAFGDANVFSLCPSNPDAREYVCTLVEDLTATYRPDMVELETPGFMPYRHGFHHEIDAVGLTAEDEFLLSLCFCPACKAGATIAGIDAEGALGTVRRLVTEALQRAVPSPRWPDFAMRKLDALAEFPQIQAYVRWRSEPVTSLVAAIRERAHPDSRVTVVDIRDGWLGGCDAAAIGRACDGMIFCCYDMSVSETGDTIAAGRAAIGGDKYLGAGFRAFYPEMSSAADMTAKAKAAVAAGADGINFYNFGLVPTARLDWIKQAATAAREGARG